MEDTKIVELFWERDEQALTETRQAYHRYLTRIARNILPTEQDTEECVNDTWLQAWNAMPPHRPPRNRAASTQNTLPKWNAVFSMPTGISILQ